METIYDFIIETNKGVTYRLGVYKGGVMLIVSAASGYGLTSQFEGLQPLYEKYKDQGSAILDSPCNQSGGQESGSDEEAAQNCKLNYGTTFPMHQRIDVKGEHQLPLFKYLAAAQHGLFSEKIKWNFAKLLVDHGGNVVKRSAPQRKPVQIERRIEKLLRSILVHSK